MADAISYVGVSPLTIGATAVAIPRGTRVALDSTGKNAAAAIGDKGEYVALHDIEASGFGAGADLAAGGKVPAVASEAVAVGDDAYTAAAGQYSKTSGGGALLVGTWAEAAASGKLGAIKLA